MTNQSDDDNYDPHSFNPTIAQNFGINAAIIFQYISFRSRHSPAPDKFVRLTLPDFQMQYPYMGSWEIRLALDKLTLPASRPSSISPGKISPAIVHRRLESDGYSYAPICHDIMGTTKHRFDRVLAAKIGVLPAIIYDNVSYWIKFNWDVAFNEVYQKIDPADFNDDDFKVRQFAAEYTKPKAAHHGKVRAWAAEHPYVTLRSAERGFQQLVQIGLLKVTHTTRKIPVWELAPEGELDYLRILLDVDDLGVVKPLTSKHLTAKTAVIPPKPQPHRQNRSLTAKTAAKSQLNNDLTTTCAAVDEAVLKAGSVAFGSVVVEASFQDMSSSLRDSSASPSLPQRDEDAAAAPPLTLPAKLQLTRTQMRDALEALNPETVSKIRHLNRAHVPKLKKELVRDAFGLPAVRVKRKYTRHPKPGDDGFDEYVEGLPIEERVAARRLENEYFESKSLEQRKQLPELSELEDATEMKTSSPSRVFRACC